MAGILSAFINANFIATHLGKRGFLQILKATIIGVPNAVMLLRGHPVTASLREHGAGKGASTAFLASTPQTGVDSIMATWGLMGPFFTVVRVIAAFMTGIISGSIVDLIDPDTEQALHPDKTNTTTKMTTHHRIVDVFKFGFISLPGRIAKALIVGLFIAGTLSALLPPDFLAEHLGSGLISKLLIMGVAIPLYVCSTGSIPIALSLIQAGISPGTALIFLITGPATNAATITTMWKIMGKKTVITYLLAIITSALLIGIALDAIPTETIIGTHAMHHATSDTWWPHICATLLVIVLVHALIQPFRKRTP